MVRFPIVNAFKMAITRRASTKVTKTVTSTRSKVTKVETETGVSNIDTSKAKIVKTKVKVVKKAGPKPLLEDLLLDIKPPADFSLPQTFIDFHDEEFVQGVKHIISIDSSLYPVITYRNFDLFRKGHKDADKSSDEKAVINSYWNSLISSVIGQQISGMAAKAIRTKFDLLFPGKPNAKETLEFSTEQLRSCGLSNQKVKYVVDISEKFEDPELNFNKLKFYKESSTDGIIQELVKLKGIGVWSAKMFSVFTLKELDVFAEDDLGVARGTSRYFEKRPETIKKYKKEIDGDEEIKQLMKKKGKFEKASSKRDWKPYHDQIIKFTGNKFAPYQLIAMLIMWRLSATNVDVLKTET